jgi:hypothetical protein
MGESSFVLFANFIRSVSFLQHSRKTSLRRWLRGSQVITQAQVWYPKSGDEIIEMFEVNPQFRGISHVDILAQLLINN